MGHSRWNLLPPVPPGLATGSALPPLILDILYHRGVVTLSQIEAFLAADARLSVDPFLLPDMHQAVGRLYQALLSGERVTVYGDYDVDGVSGTALLVQGLSLLGAEASPYIPHRMTEGYGLKTSALEQIRGKGTSLVVTVDCGITGAAEVQKAKRLGLDIIITDHHTPLSEIPPAVAVVDPKLVSTPFPEFTGAGMAFKLLQALLRSLNREDRLEELVDLAALGTVADMAPLLGENRYLVKRGLQKMNTAPRLGIREIVTQAALQGSLDSEAISWVVAPRLNTAGRLAHALTSYQLLTTDSPQEARELAVWLEGKNAERQELTTQAVARAREQVLSRGIFPLLLVGDGECPPGVMGLVASRLADEFYRPAVMVRRGERTSSGSCRSIPEFNMVLALSQCGHLLTQFGGHSQAAGFVLPTSNLPRLEEELLRIAAGALEGLDLRPQIDIDAEVALGELGGKTYQLLQKLAPFGQGNPNPVFLSRGVEVVDCRTMGNNGGHLRLKLRQCGVVWEAVAFGWGSCQGEISSPLDMVYSLELDRWCGEERLRLNVLDFASSRTK
ncbi:MAG: single-stranded-DNA-specific exonuclease RecJ [Chloroflexota bacterium]